MAGLVTELSKIYLFPPQTLLSQVFYDTSIHANLLWFASYIHLMFAVGVYLVYLVFWVGNVGRGTMSTWVYNVDRGTTSTCESANSRLLTFFTFYGSCRCDRNYNKTKAAGNL